jgi:3D (Asp-Asp-Asp) domain-containing protein
LALGPLDRVEPPAEATVPAGGVVRVVRVREEERREIQFIPFRTQVRYDDGLIPGTRRRLRPGAMGLIERVISVIFEDGVETGRRVVGETVLREPVDEIMLVGPVALPAAALRGAALPALSEPSGPPAGARVARVLLMEVTAYDPGPASTGKRPGDPGYGITAIGMRAGYGVAAVDPRVIPFYTRLYVPGYGYAIAGDTGGAIVGHRLDVGFASYWEAVRWGRRTLPVYVLE